MRVAAYSPKKTAAATGITAYGQYQGGQQAKAEGKTQSEMAARNAKIAEMNAGIQEETARENVRQNRRMANKILGENRAMLAEGGGGGGSLLAVAGETAAELEKDIQVSFGNDLIDADRWRNQAVADRMEGRLLKTRGKNAARAGRWGAGSTILSGASRTYGAGYDMGLWGKSKTA